MSKIEGIERLEGRGITAKVTDSGRVFSTYTDFAKAVGYPDAVDDELVGEVSKGEEVDERTGETFTVLAKGKHSLTRYGYVYVIESLDDKRFLIAESGLAITYPPTKTADKLDEMDYDKLIEYADEVNLAVRRKAYAQGYGQGTFDAHMNEITGEMGNSLINKDGEEPEESALNTTPIGKAIEKMTGMIRCSGINFGETQQQKRDRIVEQAKDDVSNINRNGIVKFFVNSEKRTVVAVLIGYLSGKVNGRGIAKCAPGDCFNAHIGKAIALRRALGLDVPDEYIYAPQPTEARIGNIVTKPDWRHIEPYEVSDIIDGFAFERNGEFASVGGLEVIDDTRSEEAPE